MKETKINDPKDIVIAIIQNKRGSNRKVMRYHQSLTCVQLGNSGRQYSNLVQRINLHIGHQAVNDPSNQMLGIT